MATTDKRGRRVAGADTRVSEEAKASLPAYGFEGMTIGEISDLKREKLQAERDKRNSDAAEGKTRLTTEDKKR